MNEPAAARGLGRALGLLSGLFAVLQVMVSVSAATTNAITIRGLQRAFDSLTTNTPLSPFNLLADLVPVLVATYLSAAVAGLIMIGFAWYAGRLTARTLGRRAYGGMAGLWVSLWSGLIWLGLSAIATLLTHADGTLSGILTSSPGTSRLGAQLIFLLLQNGLAALCGLGFGALAGFIGASGAPVPSRPAIAYVLPGYGIPAAPGTVYNPLYGVPPGAMPAPPPWAAANPPPPTYPPSPEQYQPEQSAPAPKP
jgi:hypothetical protein